jgi:Helicase conserved C-terminal domain
MYSLNKYLKGFLKPMPNKKSQSHLQSSTAGGKEEVVVRAGETEGQSLHVLLSTLLLACGLDFDPSVSYIFILDPLWSTADFLHHAGRTACMGGRGKVILFGKGGRCGTGKLREMCQKLAALATLA